MYRQKYKIRHISTDHFDHLTDEFGIWQHTRGKVIDRVHGYALDDAARGLIFAVKIGDMKKIDIFQRFLKNAFMPNRIVNFFGSMKEPLDSPWSEDALGQSYWALSLCKINNYLDNESMIDRIVSSVANFSSVRGVAYSIMGASLINPIFADELAEKLCNIFMKNRSNQWAWIEDMLSYGNSIIPLSLLTAGRALSDSSYINSGLEMLNFLNSKTKKNGIPFVVGNKGWYKRDKKPALYDQQPIDAGYQVLANLEAWKTTNDVAYLEEAKLYFSWFWGNNILGKPLIDIRDDSCRDGFCRTKVDSNRGAESIICYLLAQEEIWPHL